MLNRLRLSMPQSDFILRHSLSMTTPGPTFPVLSPRRRGMYSSTLATDTSDGVFLTPAAAACSSSNSMWPRAASSAWNDRRPVNVGQTTVQGTTIIVTAALIHGMSQCDWVYDLNEKADLAVRQNGLSECRSVRLNRHSVSEQTASQSLIRRIRLHACRRLKYVCNLGLRPNSFQTSVIFSLTSHSSVTLL